MNACESTTFDCIVIATRHFRHPSDGHLPSCAWNCINRAATRWIVIVGEAIRYGRYLYSFDMFDAVEVELLKAKKGNDGAKVRDGRVA